MLSVILLCHAARDAGGEARRRERVARGLASLVAAAVDGLVGDVTLIGPASAGLGAIADEAGCGLAEHDDPKLALGHALSAARQAHVFLLDAGFAIDRGFIEEARDALAFGGLEPARVLRAAPDGFFTRLAPSLALPVGVIGRTRAVADLVAASAVFHLPTVARRLRGIGLAAHARKCA